MLETPLKHKMQMQLTEPSDFFSSQQNKKQFILIAFSSSVQFNSPGFLLVINNS